MLKKISVHDIKENIFELIGKRWGVVAVKSNDEKNAMTISWGFFGYIWNKPGVEIFIHPYRYTHKLLENSEYFTINFFSAEYKDKVMYFGTVSGEDENKIEKSGLSTIELENYNTFCFEEAKLVLICKKLYVDTFKKDLFLYKEDYMEDEELGILHKFYIGEIVEVLSRE